MNDLRRRNRRPVRLAVACLVAVAAAAMGSSAASAGGWAMASLDAVPTPNAGDTVTVGFVVLQHGTTPEHPEGDVGIDLVGPEGATYVPATPDGDGGHYTAQVAFPVEGSYTWTLRLGWFEPQDLGVLEVGPSTSTSTSGGSSLGTGLLVAGGLLAAAAAGATWRGRLRDRTSALGGHDLVVSS